MKRFLITGLPRTRTAWMSVLFNHEECWCEHELTAIDPDLKRLDHEPLLDTAGTCDSGALLIQPPEFWHDYRVVIICRPMEDVRRSLQKLGVAGDAVDHSLREIQKRLDGMISSALHAQYRDLRSYDVCNDIWRYIGNPKPLSRERFDSLSQFNIQRQGIGRHACLESTRRLQGVMSA